MDPSTGHLTYGSDTPYHDSTGFDSPIRVSPDGLRVLLGSGYMYDGLSLERLSPLPRAFEDALWRDDGTVITIHKSGTDTVVEQWGPDLQAHEQATFNGWPLAIVSTRLVNCRNNGGT